MMEYESQLSEIIANLLISKISQNSPKKRARSLKSNSQSNSGPSAEQVSSQFKSQKDVKFSNNLFFSLQLLNHLEHLRKCCSYVNNSNVTAMYVHEKMQRALQQAFAHCDDRQKVNFTFKIFFKDEIIVKRLLR